MQRGPDGLGTRAARRAQFDRFVAREYAGLWAEAAVLLDDRDDGERLLHRALAAARRDWQRRGTHADPADRVRDALVARLGQDGLPPGDASWERPPALGALRALPVVQRRALVLHHVLGRSVGRVAADTGASVPTVRRRLTHGAWALASRHPDAVTVPRSGACGTDAPIERWAAVELGALRRTVASGSRRPATATGTATCASATRRVVVRAAATVGAMVVLAVVGAAWADLSQTPAPSPALPPAPSPAQAPAQSSAPPPTPPPASSPAQAPAEPPARAPSTAVPASVVAGTPPPR